MVGGSVIQMIITFHFGDDDVGDRYRIRADDRFMVRILQRLVLVVVVVCAALSNDHPPMMMMVTTTVTAVAASPPSPVARRTHDTSITTIQNYIRRRHSILDRLRNRMPRHGIVPPPGTTTTTRISGRTKRKHQSVVGTKLTFRSPTKERLTKWYCDQHGPSTDDPSVEMTNMVHTTPHYHATKTPMVNHPYAGMTNPTVNYQLYHNNGTSVPECHTDRDEPQQWWPPVSSLLQRSQPSTSLRGHKNRHSCWRVLQYRQTVGHGYDCYQTCRDAILAWEFQNLPPPKNGRRFLSFHRSQGIIALPPVSESFEDSSIRRRRTIDPTTTKETSLDTTDSAQQIRWGPGQRLITYTSTPTISLSSSSAPHKWINVLNRFLQHQLPKLHVVNPVTVLYNVVDQNGGGGPASVRTHNDVGSPHITTYTSTAYGTGYGHWLCGEERITVCYRHATIGDHPDDDNRQGCVDVEIVSYSKPHSTIGRIVYPFLRPLQHSFFVSHMNYLQNLANATQ